MTDETLMDQKAAAAVETQSGEVKPNEELVGKIVDQIEYYFGDINLGRDKFLMDEVKKDDGWISLATLLKFNRLQKLTKEATVIAEALKNSELLEISEDKTKIRRSLSRPIRNLTKEELSTKTVYAKGFPLDATLDDVKEFFKTFGDTDNIQMRKDFKKNFKGSCFVVFRTDEDAKKFTEAPDIKYKDTEMLRLFKDDYFKSKIASRKQKSEEKSKKTDEQKQEKEKEERENLKEKMTSGAVLNVEGIAKGTKREDIKDFFMKFGTVEWIDFNTGDEKGRVRFSEKDEATSAFEKAKTENDGKIKIGESEVECRVLEGEEELDHWAGIFKAKQDKAASNSDWSKRKRRGGGGDRRGDRRGGGGRRGEPHRKRGKPSGANKEDSDGGQDNDDD